MKNHTVKRIPLPAGWENFKIAETDHPGEGWLNVKEFASIAKLSTARSYAVLNGDENMQKCTRLVAGRNIVYYRPKSAAKSGK